MHSFMLAPPRSDGRSGSSCSCSTRGWPTRRRSQSTGAQPWARVRARRRGRRGKTADPTQQPGCAAAAACCRLRVVPAAAAARADHMQEEKTRLARALPWPPPLCSASAGQRGGDWWAERARRPPRRAHASQAVDAQNHSLRGQVGGGRAGGAGAVGCKQASMHDACVPACLCVRHARRQCARLFVCPTC